MADFFLDPVGGNDANDGTTFANRWKTFTSGATAARIAPGDRIKIIASPDPTSVGNATWTDGSTAVTLAAACTQTIDNCEDAWTASANVTATAISTSPRKQGNNVCSIAFSAGFTTGKAAYRTLPAPLDLSGYQQVSFWIYTNIASAAGTLELRLCTDTTGDTVAHTIPIDQTSVGGGFRVVVKDFGSNLNSAIASISLYCNLDPSTLQLRLDNIIACKASSSDDSLTHLSLIGKNTAGEPEWYPIISIDGTDVQLGSGNDANIHLASAAPRPYKGTTETVTTYKLQPLDMVNQGVATPAASNNSVMDSGTEGNQITFSGGWDRTNMSTQSGETWTTGSHWAASMFSVTSKDWLKFENIGMAHFTDEPIVFTSGSDFNHIELVGVVGCESAFSGSVSSLLYADYGNIVGCFTHAITASLVAADFTIKARRICNGIASGISAAADNGTRYHFHVDRIDNNGNYGVIPAAQNSGELAFYNTTMENNVTADVNGVSFGQRVLFMNCEMLSTTPISTAAMAFNDMVIFHRYGQNANDHRTYTGGYWITSDETVRHTASGISWKLSPKSATLVSAVRNARVPLLRAKLTAGSHDISLWMRRDNTALTCGIRVLQGAAIGVTATVSAAMAAAADTWEQVTLTIAPTEDCVVEVEGWAYGGTTYSCWFDDALIT